MQSKTKDTDFKSGNNLYRAVKLNKNSDTDKYKKSGYSNEVHVSDILLSRGIGFDKNVTMFGSNFKSAMKKLCEKNFTTDQSKEY